MNSDENLDFSGSSDPNPLRSEPARPKADTFENVSAEEHQGDAADIIFGQILKLLRRELRSPYTGRRLSQRDLFLQCQVRENPPHEERRVFTAQHEDHQKTIIMEFELGRKRCAFGHKRVFERVFGLPEYLLDVSFSSVPHFLSERQKRTLSATRQKRSSVDLRGLRNLGSATEVTPGREAVISAIEQTLSSTGPEAFRVVELTGSPGVGKSRLISEWWTITGCHFFKTNVIALDCTTLGGDQILRQINSHFLGVPREDVDESLVDAFVALDRNVADRPLIILDGLVVGHGQAQGTILQTRTGTDEVTLRRVRELVHELARRQAPVSLIVALQSDAAYLDPLWLSRLHAGVRVSLQHLSALSDDGGATVLERMGVKRLSRDDLIRISGKLMGLPIALEAAATYLVKADDSASEEFITRLDAKPFGFHSFIEFFERYIDLLCQNNFDQNCHPHAFLRLLALMHGPTTKALLDNLLIHKRITRLEGGSINKLLNTGVAFVKDDGVNLDLHAFVRSLLRRELDAVVNGERRDETISIEELSWIHATVGLHCLRLLEDCRSSDITSIEIADIETAIYHLLTLRNLLPKLKTAEVGERPSIRDNKPASFVQRISTLLITPAEITEFCWRNIALRYLIDKEHRVTRCLGQFETKARILTYFIDPDGEVAFLNQKDTNKLLREIGTCWMHVGRLALASASLNKSVDKSHVPVRRMENEKRADWFKKLTEPSESGRWTEHSATASTIALIMMREGRSADAVIEKISNWLAVSEDIADEAFNVSSEHITQIFPVLSSARRIIARRAHVDLMRGEINSSLARFTKATALEQLLGRQCLEGDAARRHIKALLRASKQASSFQQAKLILDYNFEILNAQKSRHQESNEIVSWYTTQIMLFRVDKKYGAAHDLLDQVLMHRFLRDGECSYVARIELELERIRLRIAEGTVTPEFTEQVGQLADQILDAHHVLYADECRLLFAELGSSSEKRVILNDVGIRARNYGWLLRWPDIQLVKEGESAVRLLGW